jgi:abortive infection bacteriophage resistance protein
MSTYSRPHLTYEKQLDLLKARGLTVTDDAAALAYLKRIGYYRLSAYWYSFRKPDARGTKERVLSRKDEFVAGTTFQQAVELYVFDKKLRMLVMDAIERIEVAVRVELAHTLGARNTFAHVDPNELHGHFSNKRAFERATGAHTGPTKHEKWLGKLKLITARSERTEDFVAHYLKKHGEPLPIWVAIELWDFGMLSHFFAGVKQADRDTVARRWGIPDTEVMTSWLRSINFARNVSAHHGRYFNRNVIDQPKLPKPGDIRMFDLAPESLRVNRPYTMLCILSYLMKQICPQSHWQRRIVEHLKFMPVVDAIQLDLRALGCPSGWEAHGFWQR